MDRLQRECSCCSHESSCCAKLCEHPTQNIFKGAMKQEASPLQEFQLLWGEDASLSTCPTVWESLRVCEIFFPCSEFLSIKGHLPFLWIIGCFYCSDTTEEWNNWPAYSGENWFSINMNQPLSLSLFLCLSFCHLNTPALDNANY